MPSRMNRANAIAIAMTTLAIASCGPSKTEQDPLGTLRDPDRNVTSRSNAARLAWQDVEQGRGDRQATRKTLKDLAWSSSAEWPIRREAMTALLSDTDPDGLEDARRQAKLMLPRERSREMVALICSTAASRGWTDFTTPIVRSFARPVEAFEDQERVEYKALRTLHPGRPATDVVFDVFLDPDVEDNRYTDDFLERARADAWDVLGRLDKDGSIRIAMLTGGSGIGAIPADDDTIADLRACLADLRAIPLTADELRWLRSVRQPGNAANAAWWGETSSAIDQLPPQRRNGLNLRHAEPIRWAARNSPQILTASRADLMRELSVRLQPRRTYSRSVGGKDTGKLIREGLENYGSQLHDADLIAVLVIDEAMRREANREDLFRQAELDRRDKTTEYGGLLRQDSQGDYRLVLYPPRPSTRKGDRAFVASQDMIRDGDRALAFYHMHVQDIRNAKYAGPSFQDLKFAASSGRSSLVFTSVTPDVMNVDYYQPDGVVIDLGEYVRPGR